MTKTKEKGTYVIQAEDQKTPLMAGAVFNRDSKAQLESSLIQQAKLASIGKMTCDLAHEITNPLSIIIGRTEELLRKSQNNQLTAEIVERELSKILQTSHRINRITKSLRSFGRNSEKDPKSHVFLSKVIDEALDLCLDRLHQHSIHLKRSIEPHLFVEVRASEIEQVVVNLLLNSIDALQEQSEKWIEIRAENLGPWTRIQIIDSGLGIPKHIASEIMKPFFTTKKPGLGTGLGLPISQTLILNHGGRLFLDQDAKNTCFVIELPAIQAKIK
jgi:C4-dicarboxylate-specific signal transduction histidine kinase